MALTACGPGAGKGTQNQSSGAGFVAKLQARHVDERPEIAVIVRSGDPRAGLSVTFGLDANREDTLALAALLATRLERKLLHFEVRPALDVIAVVGTLQTLASVGTIVDAIDNCLRSEVRASEVSLPSYGAHFRRLSQLDHARELTLERRGCLGEPDATRTVESAPGMDVVKRLQRLHHSVYAVQNARWGVVGSEAIVSAVVEAVRNVPSWPNEPATVRRWPKGNNAVFVQASPNRVSLVIRMGDAEPAFALSRALNNAQGETSEILAGRFPGLRLVLARPSAMSHGGCLRVDLDATPQREPAGSVELMSAARVIADAVRATGAQGGGERQTMAFAALEQSDPVSASMFAAEVSLSKRETSQVALFYLNLQGEVMPAGTKHTPETMLDDLLGPIPAKTTLGTLTRVESGQGKMYALLASPCVPALEPKRLVGSSALFLSAISKRYTGLDGVTLQPWVSPEGAGLFASTGKRSAEETTSDQAERLGRALGRAATSLPPDNDVFWQHRATSLVRLGPGPRPALWQALQALAPEHPGLVAPEGVYETVEGIAPLELRERQRQWQSQALRLALLLSDTENAAERVPRAIARWGLPQQRDASSCQLDQVESAVPGPTIIEVDPGSFNDAAVTLSLRLPSGDGLSSVYARWLLRLLTAPEGPLDRIGRVAQITAQFEATVVGGTKRRGLVVALGAPPDQVDVAVEALKKLFVDIGNGNQPTAINYTELEAWHREREYGRRADPRQRLVELWSRTGGAPETSEVSFRNYLRRAFIEGEVRVVRATPKPEKAQVSAKTGSIPSSTKPLGKAKSASRP